MRTAWLITLLLAWRRCFTWSKACSLVLVVVVTTIYALSKTPVVVEAELEDDAELADSYRRLSSGELKAGHHSAYGR